MTAEITPKVKINKQSSLMASDHKLNLSRIHKTTQERSNTVLAKYATISDHERNGSLDGPYHTFDYDVKVSEEYQSQYTVKDPHMVFYKQCRERNRDKELHKPMKLGAKNQSSYERIKKEL